MHGSGRNIQNRRRNIRDVARRKSGASADQKRALFVTPEPTVLTATQRVGDFQVALKSDRSAWHTGVAYVFISLPKHHKIDAAFRVQSERRNIVADDDARNPRIVL